MSAPDNKTFVIGDHASRRDVAALVARLPEGWVVTIKPPQRTCLQNRFLHALLSDVANQLPWPKGSRDFHGIEWWKRRCTLQWLIDDKQPVEVIADLDEESQFALLLPHTSHLSSAQCASLSEWVIAFGVTHGVLFRDQRRPA